MGFFNYFQIAVIGIIVCAIVTKALYSWHVTGIFPIVIGRGKGAWRVFEFLSFVALFWWITEVLLRAFGSRFEIFPDTIHVMFLHSQVVRSVGVVLIVLGLIIFLLAFVNFGTSWRVGIDRKTPGTLVTGGIFAVTRNPIYVAFNAIFPGIFLVNGTWFFLIFALLAFVAMHFQIRREEEYLKKQYGKSYAEYRRHAPRYLIW